MHLLAIGRPQAVKPGRFAVTGDYLPFYRAQTRMPKSAFSGKYRQGQVVVTFTVTREGRICAIRITESSPPGVVTREGRICVIRITESSPPGVFRQGSNGGCGLFPRFGPRFRDGEPVDTPGVTYTWEFRMEG